MAKQIFANNATGYLQSSITNVATSITLQSGQGTTFPSPTGSDYYYATLYDGVSTIEIVKVTARTSDTLTVVRGQEGTTASVFASGSKFEVRITKAGLDNFVQRTGDSATLDTLTVTGVSTFSNNVSVGGNLSITGSVSSPTFAGTDNVLTKFVDLASMNGVVVRGSGGSTANVTELYAGGVKSATVTTTGLSVAGILSSGNTGSGSHVALFSNNDQSNARVRIANTGAGGQIWSLVAGTPGASNSGLAIYNETGSATVAQFSSTGLSVIGDGYFSGNLIQTVNSTAPTLSTNQTMAFELTSNTQLKVKVRGSDGTTRSATLTLT